MSFRKSLITRLKTGTIKNVYNREDGITNPVPPYVIVWEESPIVTGSLERGHWQFRIAVHVAEGNTDIMDAYIRTEVRTLLNRVNLTDATSGEVREVFVTKEITPAIKNDDKTVSRDILIQTPSL